VSYTQKSLLAGDATIIPIRENDLQGTIFISQLGEEYDTAQ
jgi:hypothetical protein